jgi:hypothetical protein
MHESERNRLVKLQQALLLAASDMDHAEAAAHALEDEGEDLALMRALETAIAVCYARAFTQSSLMTLPREYLPEEPSDRELHRYLADLRDTVYAHTDKASGRKASTTMTAETGEVVTVEVREEWIPLPRDLMPAAIDLFRRQARRFRRDAVGIAKLLEV